MKSALSFAAMALFVSASISYFKYDRPVQVSVAGQQHYAVADQAMWEHSHGLQDVRLYSGTTEVPYALTVERGSSENVQTSLRVLQPGIIGGKTQFILDMAGLAEYDRVELNLSARNFVVKAEVAGQDDLHGSKWVTLGRTVLYDLSADRLGGNSTLRLPLTAYKYLRVTLDGQIKPGDVKGASASLRHEEKEVWREVAVASSLPPGGQDSVFTASLPGNMPVERIEFAVSSAQPDFMRTVEIQNEKGERIGSGEIRRVHTVRHGQRIDAEASSFPLYTAMAGTIKILVHNGDDQPLKIDSVRLMQYERRIYFTPQAAGTLHFYYGDEKLGAPVYDYAKLFQKDPSARPALLSMEEANTAFTGRPDDRPWSERHPALLWVAIIAAVIVLGAVALRSMKSATT